MPPLTNEQVEELRKRAEALANGDGPAKRALRYRTLREIVTNPLPAPPKQIAGICREGEMGILTGPANRLKSRTGAELARAVASRKPAFGYFAVERPGRALIIQNEIHPGVHDERMVATVGGEEDEWLDDLLVVSRENFRLDPAQMLSVDNLMTEEKITFAVLDPLSEMWPLEAGFDENRSTDITAVLERIKELRDKGRTLLLVHHDPKAEDRKARGSGRLIDAPDLRIYLTRANKKGAEIGRAKVHIESRTMPPPEDFDIVLSHGGRLRYESESLTAQQNETIGVLRRLGGATAEAVAQALHIESHAARGRLERLREKGKVRSEGSPLKWWVLTGSNA